MNKILKFFGKEFEKSMKNTFKDLKNLASEIEKKDFQTEFEKLSESFNDEFEKLKDKFLKKKDKYVVAVEYDRDTQILSTKIEDKIFTVTVENCVDCGNNITQKSTLTVTIPDDVCVDKITQKYDAEQKKMFFTMKKESVHFEVIQDENEMEDDDNENHEVELPEEDECPKWDGEQIQTQNEVEPKKTKESLIDLIMRMYNDGMTYKAISREVGLSDKTVAKYVKRVLNQ